MQHTLREPLPGRIKESRTAHCEKDVSLRKTKTGRTRRLRIARGVDVVSLRALLSADAMRNSRLELVLADGTRLAIARGLTDTAVLRSLAEANRVGSGARLELVVKEG